MLSGYNYIKERNLVLPDLKPTNILIDEYDTIKVYDLFYFINSCQTLVSGLYTQE